MDRADKLPLTPLPEHFDRVVQAILKDDVVPFLGAGANLCGHDDGAWHPDSPRLPLGGELARHLAGEVDYKPRSFKVTCVCHRKNNTHEFQEVIDDLLRISQYVQLTRDQGFLYNRLKPLFDRDYSPTILHWLLANLPAKLAEHKREPAHVLVVTTNYDDIMERTFKLAGEPFDVVYYMAVGRHRGKFIHKARDGEISPVKPNENKVSLRNGSIVFKIHGGVQRGDADAAEQADPLDYPSSYVITEDNYIDYLAQVHYDSLPVALRTHMMQSNFLFLGYSLRDWNLRAFLHRIWNRRPLDRKSWAIQRGPEPLEADFWRNRSVEIYDYDLHDYASELCARLHIPAMPAMPAAPRAPLSGRRRPGRTKTV